MNDKYQHDGDKDASVPHEHRAGLGVPDVDNHSPGQQDPKAGDLTRRHDVPDIPISGTARVILFLIGIGLLVGGLSLAVPDTSLADPYLVRALLVLLIFGSVAAFWSRQSIFKIVKMVGLWGVIISGLSAFYLYRSEFGDRFMTALDPSAGISTDEGIIIHRSADGHFWVRTLINGNPLRMMVDTGASNIVLSPEDARNVGINPDTLAYTGRAETANGSVSLARTEIESLRIGNALLSDVPITVNGAEMRGSLLGLSALGRFSSFEFRGDQLILRQ